jgi:hypothetical protein
MNAHAELHVNATKQKSYDASKVQITFKGLKLEGAADGTFVEVEVDPVWTRQVQARPVPVSGKTSGTISVTLMSKGDHTALTEYMKLGIIEDHEAREWKFDTTKCLVDDPCSGEAHCGCNECTSKWYF